MKTTKALQVGVGLLVTLMSACATTDTSSTTWAAGAPPPGYEAYSYPPGPYARAGQVQTGYSPFAPGQRVVLTPQGLAPG
jgi:hypothetical protein